MITKDGNFICDICGGASGEYHTETGNHVSCDTISKLQSTIASQAETIKQLNAVRDASIEVIDIATVLKIAGFFDDSPPNRPNRQQLVDAIRKLVNVVYPSTDLMKKLEGKE